MSLALNQFPSSLNPRSFCISRLSSAAFRCSFVHTTGVSPSSLPVAWRTSAGYEADFRYGLVHVRNNAEADERWSRAGRAVFNREKDARETCGGVGSSCVSRRYLP